MYTEWTKHLKTPEEKAQFVDSLIGSKRVLDRLSQLLEEHEQTLERSETSLTAYDLPNWDYRQAHKNGYRAHLNAVKKLINLDQQRKNK